MTRRRLGTLTGGVEAQESMSKLARKEAAAPKFHVILRPQGLLGPHGIGQELRGLLRARLGRSGALTSGIDNPRGSEGSPWN